MNEVSKFARESFDRTLETGAETVRGVFGADGTEICSADKVIV